MNKRTALRYVKKMINEANVYMRNFAYMNGWTHPHVLVMQENIKNMWKKHEEIKNRVEA